MGIPVGGKSTHQRGGNQPHNKKKEETKRKGDPPHAGTNGFHRGNPPLQKWVTLAANLKDALSRNNRVCRGTIDNSADSIRLIAEQDKQPVEKVLEWLCSEDNLSISAKQRYKLPSIENGGQLRRCWTHIYDAYLREHPDTCTSPASEEAEAIVEKLSDLQWPKGSASQLPELVQASLDAYRTFRKKKRKLDESDAPRPIASLSGEIAHYFSKPSTFIAEWFRVQNESVQGWEDWSGKLQPFSLSAKQFLKMGREMASDFCGDASRFDRFLEEVKGVQL